MKSSDTSDKVTNNNAVANSFPKLDIDEMPKLSLPLVNTNAEATMPELLQSSA